MLYLNRKIGQELLFVLPDGSEVRLTVCRVDGARVRLGIDAKRSIPVHRQEVQDLLKKQEAVVPPT